MPAATPTLSTVIANTVTEVDAITSPVALDNVFGFKQRFEAKWEDLEPFQNTTTGVLDVVYVFPENTDEVEGRATGQNFPLYNVVVEYYSVRVNVANWSDVADDVGVSILDKLNKNASIFAIAGQRQILTPETVRAESMDFDTVEDVHGNFKRVYKVRIVFQAEARRFG